MSWCIGGVLCNDNTLIDKLCKTWLEKNIYNVLGFFNVMMKCAITRAISVAHCLTLRVKLNCHGLYCYFGFMRKDRTF